MDNATVLGHLVPLAHTDFVNREADSSVTGNAIVRWDGTGGRDVQDSGVIIDDSDNVTGMETLLVNTTIEVGDPGTETAGVNINGSTYALGLRVTDFGGSRQGQVMLHRHSTSFPSLIIGSRSNSDTSAHANVNNNTNLMEIAGAGWTGSHYDFAGAISIKTDDTGTISSTSSPGKIEFATTPDGSNTPTLAMTIRNDQDVEMTQDLDVTGTITAAGLDLNFTQGSVVFIDSNGALAQDNSGFFYDNTNNLLAIGSSNTTDFDLEGANVTSRFTVNTESTTFYSFVSHASGASVIGKMAGARSRGTRASPTSVQSGDAMWWFEGVGFDSTAVPGGEFREAVRMVFSVDGTPAGSGVIPGKISFYTSPNTAGGVVERLSIDKDGLIDFGTATLTAAGALDNLTELDVDNININGNTISVTNTNGALTVQQNGTGNLTLGTTNAQLVCRPGSGALTFNVSSPTDLLHLKNVTSLSTRATMKFESETATDFVGVVFRIGGAVGEDYQFVINSGSSKRLRYLANGTPVFAWGTDGFIKVGNAGAPTTCVDTSAGTGTGIRSRGRLTLNRITVSDANYTVLTDDCIVAYTSLTTGRTVTLPDPNTTHVLSGDFIGSIIIIKDETGSAGANNITINAASGDTIDGAGSTSITSNHGVVRLYAAGGNEWFTW